MLTNFTNQIIFWLVPFAILSFWYLREIIFPFLAGIIIGTAIQTLAYYASKKTRINFYFVVFLIYAILIILSSLSFYFVFKVFLDQVPAFIDNLEKFLETHKISYKNFKLEFQIKELTDIVNKYFANVFNFLMNFFGGLISVILVFIVSIYVAFMKNFPEVYVKFFSFENEDEIIRLIRKIKLKVGFWLLGLIFLSFFIGISTYIFTGWVLDLKYAPTVSLAAGFFEILPVLGPIISLILGTAAVLVDKPEATLLVIGFFILLQQIENHFLVPLVMKKAISINPLFVIFSILIGGKIGGILGIITILPIVGIIVEVINYLKMRGGVMGSTLPSGGKDPGSSPGPAD